MSPKLFLVLMTTIAVVSDSMLHPFYPQYFERVFGVNDPWHVGFYVAMCSLTVLLAFPLWALLARRIPTLRLLVATQIATALLSLACAEIDSLTWFWVVSLGMMLFKASYLLIYPYVMSLEAKDEHVGTISLLALTVYFGNIFAALLSGVIFELLDPPTLFFTMAAGDVLQIALCLYLLKAPTTALEAPALAPAVAPLPPALPRYFVYKLGLVMLVMYFSAYVTEPFFSMYWEHVAALDNKIVSGCVFAIPGFAALLGLYVNARAATQAPVSPYAGIVPAVLLGIASLWLQATGQQFLVLVGRFVYGWALFQSMVRLDSLLFRLSTPEQYSLDFSKINLFQGLGVLLASLSAGSLVTSLGLTATFVMAGGGFLASVVLFCVLFRKDWWQAARTMPDEHAVGTGGVVT